MRTLPALSLIAFASLLPDARGAPQTDEEIETLVARERAGIDLLRRRGKVRTARAELGRMLEEEPADAASRTLYALCHFEQGHYERALEQGRRALQDAHGTQRAPLQAACARNLSHMLLGLGRYQEALLVLEPLAGQPRFLDPGGNPRDAWALGRALSESGDREASRRIWELGQQAPHAGGWRELRAKALCEWALGRLQDASRSLVLADRAARADEGLEPDVLATLGRLYFESEREVDVRGQRSAGDLFREALELHATHETALLGLFALHRYNRQRISRTPSEILNDLLGVHPDSIEGLLASASADISDGRLRSARATVARLRELASGRREVSTLRAALARVEHRTLDCEALLSALARTNPTDSRPEREVGRHLIDLYRFAEALPFLERAVVRDATDFDAWTYLGRALANTGDEDRARDALTNAKKAAQGRQDAWRNNTTMVLERMRTEHVIEEFGSLGFSWRPDASEVLRTYLVPFYREAREELAQRYGHTPESTRIEIFRRHADFSVRSVGFEGFPALGVCFGPVITALSPLAEMRGNFSWARTGFHEFSHVIHLGLSHNRCPRWITEGLATWEEVNRNPSWTRNMRRDLIDARANGRLIEVRELNRAFRGPRILFGYYQGGLLCEMLIEDHGFSSMIHLLRAFDRGLDLDQALGEVFSKTPEELDAEFEVWVDEHIAGLVLEPRWQPLRVARLRLTLAREVPTEPAALEAWADGWATVAWGSWQQGQRLDAQEALRRLAQAGQEPPRALALRGELALDARKPDEARALWTRAVAAGGRDFRALLGLGGLHEAAFELEEAERYYLMAEEVFPGYDHPEFNAELKLASLYLGQGRVDDRMAALERWLFWKPGEYDARMEVAKWHVEHERWERVDELFSEANQVDPFRRDLHIAWALDLAQLGRFEEALREFRVAALVPPELDLDHVRYIGPADELPSGIDPDHLPTQMIRVIPPENLEGLPLTAEERVMLLHGEASCLTALGREEEAQARLAEAALLETED